MELPDFPPKVDIQSKIYHPLPRLTASIDWNALDALATAEQVLREFSTALESAEKRALAGIFLSDQTYWRDTAAMTFHLRTFKGREVIVPALIELNSQRRVSEINITPRSAKTVVASETLVSSPVRLVIILSLSGSQASFAAKLTLNLL
jgi:hypothetical protein